MTNPIPQSKEEEHLASSHHDKLADSLQSLHMEVTETVVGDVDENLENQSEKTARLTRERSERVISEIQTKKGSIDKRVRLARSLSDEYLFSVFDPEGEEQIQAIVIDRLAMAYVELWADLISNPSNAITLEDLQNEKCTARYILESAELAKTPKQKIILEALSKFDTPGVSPNALSNYKYWQSLQPVIKSKVQAKLELPETEKIEEKKNGFLDKSSNFVSSSYDKMIDLFNKFKYSGIATKIAVFAGAALILKIAWPAMKSLCKKVLGIGKTIENKVEDLSKSTGKKVLLGILAGIGLGPLASLAYTALTEKFKIEDIINIFNKDGVEGVAKLFLSDEGNIDPKLVDWAKQHITDTVAGSAVKVAETLGVDEAGQKKIEDLIRDPRFDKAWDSTKTELKSTLNKIGISDVSFLESLEGDMAHILTETGFSAKEIEAALSGTALADIPSWIGSGSKIAGSGLLMYVVFKHILSFESFKKFGWSGAKLTLYGSGLYLIMKSFGLNVPIADDIVPEEIQETLNVYGNSECFQELLVYLSNAEVLNGVNNFLIYIKDRAEDFYTDLSGLPIVGPIMPTLQDIRNLNPILLLSMFMKDGLGADEAMNAMVSASKMQLSFWIVKHVTGNSKLKGLAIFSIYCFYKESQKIEEIPKDILSLEGFEYLFKSIDDVREYGRGFYNSLIEGLKEHEETRAIISSIESLQGEGITLMSVEWFTRLATILKNYGNLSIVLSETGFSIVGLGWKIVKNTNYGYAKSGLMMLGGAISMGAGGDSGLMQQGLLEFGRTSMPFIVLGAALDRDDTFAKARELQAMATGVTTTVAIPTMWMTIKGVKHMFTRELVNGVAGEFKIVSSVRAFSEKIVSLGPSGLFAKFVKGVGWVIFLNSLKDAAIEYSKGDSTKNEELGDVQKTKAGVNLASAGAHLALGSTAASTRLIASSGGLLRAARLSSVVRNSERLTELVRLARVARLGALASSSTGVGIPIAVVGVLTSTAIEAASSGVLAALESEEEISKGVEDWMAQPRRELMAHLIITNDSLTFGDSVNLGRDNETIISDKKQSRKEIWEALIRAEDSSYTDQLLVDRLNYIRECTQSSYSPHDQGELTQILNNSRRYAEAMLAGLIAKKATQEKMILELSSGQTIDLTNDEIRKSRDIHLMNQIASAYTSLQQSEAKVEIPQNYFDSFANLDDKTLIFYLNQLELYVNKKGRREETEKFFQLYEHLKTYVQKVRNLYFVLDYQEIDELDLEEFVQSMDQQKSDWAAYSYIDQDPIAYALYELASGFGYVLDGKMENLRKFFDKEHSEQRGIYWDGDEWCVRENGMELDDEYGNDGRETVLAIIARIRENNGNVLGYKHDRLLDLGQSGTYEARASQELWIANQLQKGLLIYEKTIQSENQNQPLAA